MNEMTEMNDIFPGHGCARGRVGGLGGALGGALRGRLRGRQRHLAEWQHRGHRRVELSWSVQEMVRQ